jgi:neutral ceramidase
MTLRAGFARVVITPPVGTPMEGYSARQGVSQGVHDDLYARALVIDDGATRAAIVGCDLLGVDRRLVAAARAKAADAGAAPANHIMIGATHTHAGPAGLRFDVDEALCEMTARLIAGAIVAAARDLRPVVLKAGRSTLETVSQNRRHPEWPIETRLDVLLFDSPDPARQPPVAAVVNYACHATVLYHTNLLLSGDYAGYATRTVERLTGAPAIYLNGACGNVNPVWMEQTFEEAERVGTIVGAEAGRLALEIRPLGRSQVAWNIRWDELTDKPVTRGRIVDEPRIRVAVAHVDLPVREFLDADEYDRRLADLQRRLDTLSGDAAAERHDVLQQITRYRTERQVAARGRRTGAGPHVVRPEVQAIGLAQDTAILGLPGEFFAETAEAIRHDAGVANLLVACYANHYVGYICPREVFDQGGYEAGVTLFGPGAEPQVRRTARALLREVTS